VKAVEKTTVKISREAVQNTPLDWTAEEQAFAKSCQKAMGLKEAGLATTVMPLVKEVKVGGSSDVADVSWITPVALFGWPTLPLGVSLHSWPVTACGGMSIGDKGTLASAVILAAAGYDLLTEPDLRKAAKEELTKRLDGRKYRAVQKIDPKTWDESARRFGKGPGEEAFTSVDNK
jgi:aminobenzoyl-glutamate utilization protein B